MVRIMHRRGAIVLSPPKKKVCTRATTAATTCSDFGADHHVKYPTAIFCSNCDLWVKRDIANNRLNHEMNKYKCTAQHTLLYDNPQQQQQAGYRDVPWSWRHNRLLPVSPPWTIQNSTKLLEEEEAIFEEGKKEKKVASKATSLIPLDEEIKRRAQIHKLEMDSQTLQCKLLSKSIELWAAHQCIWHLEAQVESLNATKEILKPMMLMGGVTEAINGLVQEYFPKYRAWWLSEEVAEGIWSSNCLKQIVGKQLVVLVKKIL